MVVVNGSSVNIGEFITGNIDFFVVTTLVPCDNTSVSKPLSEIKTDLGITANISTISGVNIFGTLYADDDSYTDAYNKQANVDSLIRVIQQKAQPVMLNVIDSGSVADVSTAVPINSHAANFGSVYAGNPGNIYTIKFAIEHEDIWPTQDNLANDINQASILDINTPVITNPDVFDTLSSTLRNTVVLKSKFL